ncbi:hypothetical protein MUK42_06491, partial [Musa troglodytarum]
PRAVFSGAAPPHGHIGRNLWVRSERRRPPTPPHHREEKERGKRKRTEEDSPSLALFFDSCLRQRVKGSRDPRASLVDRGQIGAWDSESVRRRARLGGRDPHGCSNQIRPSVQTNLLLLLQNRFAVRLAHSTSEKQQLKLKGGE